MTEHKQANARMSQAHCFLPYRFESQDLFQQAFIAGDSNSSAREGHRSLAQLGDQLIGFVLMSEGYDRGLSRHEQQEASSHYRRKDVCSMLAKARHLGELVKISDRQMHEGPQPTVLKNTLAAIVGAVWVDSRQYGAVREVMAWLGLINDIDDVVVPSDMMVVDTSQPLDGIDLASPGMYDMELFDWEDAGLSGNAFFQDNNELPGALSSQPDSWTLPFSGAYGATSTANMSMSSSSPVIDVLTPANSSEICSIIAPACESAAVAHPESETKSSLQLLQRQNDHQSVLQLYLGQELTKIGNVRCMFDQHYSQISKYQHALQVSDMAEPQKKTVAKLLVSIGDSSALLMLRHVLSDLQHGQTSLASDSSTADRLRTILSLECSAGNTRLVYWLHLCELISQLSRQVDIECSGSIVQEVPGDPNPKAHRRTGNPQNQKQSRISQLMMSNMPPQHATESKTKRLRRVAQRLLFLVERWQGYGVLALLGVGFNTSELMTLTDVNFKQMIELVWMVEGGRLLILSRKACPVVELIQQGKPVFTPLQLRDDTYISLLPRLSDEMDTLLSIEIGR